MTKKIHSVCVIGGGSAGTMAVLRTVLNNDDCLFFPGTPKDKKRSRALWVRKVENMPAHLGYKKGIEEPNAQTLSWIENSDFKDRLTWLKNTGVLSLKKNDENLFEITDSHSQIHYAQFVILCTGVMDVQPKIAGAIETVFDYANAQTMDYCLICDGHHVLGKKTVVIGNENSAAWVAIMLYERYLPPEMTILTNGELPQFRDDTMALLKLYKIKVSQSPITEIQGEEKGKILKGFTLADGSIVDCGLSFVALGMIVYNELAKSLGADLDERGFVKCDETGMSSIAGLYVAGDLRANTRKQIYTAWDNAVTAASSVNLQLRLARRAKLNSQALT
jgi:thioredoxin reductase (NADPH)